MKHRISIIQVLFFMVFIFLVSQGKMMLWLGVFGISLVAALVLGRVYCGYVCPMNTLMIPTEKISKKMNLQKEDVPKFLNSEKLPWIVLIGSIIVVMISKRILNKNIPFLIIWLIVSVIVTLRYKPEVFHNKICPFGVLQKTFGRVALFSKNVYKADCIGCKLCEKPCPSNAIAVKKENNKAEINPALCFQCSNCKEICPKDVIQYKNARKLLERREKEEDIV